MSFLKRFSYFLLFFVTLSFGTSSIAQVRVVSGSPVLAPNTEEDCDLSGGIWLSNNCFPSEERASAFCAGLGYVFDGDKCNKEETILDEPEEVLVEETPPENQSIEEKNPELEENLSEDTAPGTGTVNPQWYTNGGCSFYSGISNQFSFLTFIFLAFFGLFVRKSQ